jgi:hypothetical protein
VLVSERETDKGIDRVYRVRHGTRAQAWGFDLDRDGKIRGFGPK